MKKTIALLFSMFVITSILFGQKDYNFLEMECEEGKIEKFNYEYSESKVVENERKKFKKEILDGKFIHRTYSLPYIFNLKSNFEGDFDFELSIRSNSVSKTNGIYLSNNKTWANDRLILSLSGNTLDLIYYKDSRITGNLKSFKIPYQITSSSGFNTITIRRYNDVIYFFLNSFYCFNISSNSLKNFSLAPEEITHFGYQLDSESVIEVEWYKYTPFTHTLTDGSYYYHKNDDNTFPNSFKVHTNKNTLPFYNKDGNLMSFDDVIEKNRLNIVFITEMKGLTEVAKYISENILNWQLKYNAIVKTIVTDGMPVSTSMKSLSYYTDGKGFDASEMFYCPTGKYISKGFNESSDGLISIAFVNEESYLHHTSISRFFDKDNIELLNEILENRKNNIYYFEDNEKDGWCFYPKKRAGNYREIIPVSGGYKLTDYYFDNDLDLDFTLFPQMKGFYSSIYPSVKQGVFTWYTIDETTMTRNETTKIRSATYLDNILNGPSETYFDDGTLALRQNYKNGELDGLSEEYHSNGNLFIKKSYQAGKLMNIIEHKDYKGTNLNYSSLKDGNGQLLIYDEKGMNVESKQEYKNGVLDGSVQVLFLNGRKEKYSNNYTEGKYTGTDLENSLGDFGRNMIKSINEKNIYHIRDYIILPDMKDSYGDAYKMKLLMALHFIDYSKPEKVISNARTLINYDPLKLTEEKFLQYKNNTFNGTINLNAKIQHLFSFLNEKYNGNITYSSIDYSSYEALILKCKLICNTSSGRHSITLQFKNCMFGWVLYDIPGF